MGVCSLRIPMSQIPSANHSSPRADPSAAPVAEPGFEVFVHAFWIKNRGFILMLCVIVLLGIVGREGWQYFSSMREQSLQQEYAQISENPEKLVSFADANSGHPLAGVAYLQVADRKFEAADYAKAATYYSKAAGSLKNEALAGRAKLGSAMCLISSGDTVGGEAALKAVGADQTISNAARAEATYHLASMALEAGRSEDVAKFVAEITKIDLGGPWAQRATMLLSTIQTGNKSADTTAASLFKPESK